MWIKARNLFEDIKDYITYNSSENVSARASSLLASLNKNRRQLIEILKNTVCLMNV